MQRGFRPRVTNAAGIEIHRRRLLSMGLSQNEGPATRSTRHGCEPRCHICDLGIEMPYSVGGPRSTGRGYPSHPDTVAGIGADMDHHALR
jgi:hypothetical protein